MKLLFLMTILFFVFGAMTSCVASRDSQSNNEKSVNETQQSKSKTDDKSASNKTAENNSTENKSAVNEQANLVEIYDGRREVKKSKLNVDEAETVEALVSSKAAEIKKIHYNPCEGEDKFSTESVGGSFTKPNSKQTAYLYTLCNDGSAISPGVVGGIVIVEAGKPIANFTLKYYGSMDIISLPDINKNGLTEIGLLQADGGQGMQGTTLSIYEYNKAQEMATLGGTEVSVASFNSTQSNEKAYKISVAPSANPTFYREIYIKKDDAKNWTLSKKNEKFSLDAKDAPQPTLNSVD